MRLVGVPRPVFLLLCVTVLLVLSSLLHSISQRNLQFSSNPLFVFSLFNILIVALIVGNHRPCFGEVGDIIPFLYHLYELEEDAADDAEDAMSDNLDGYDNGSDHADDNDDDESEDDDFDSNGYDEDDDDDNCSDDEIGWGDMDEYDSNLEKRIRDFIDKVNKGWREERLRDTLSNPMQFRY